MERDNNLSFNEYMKTKNDQTVIILSVMIVALSLIITLTGILSDSGPGNYTYESIRGESVEIYGKGIYRHMSADVAIQGIAQDYVTLFIGIPLLVFLLTGFKNSFRKRFLITGVLGYFFVTFLFYTAMAMYNVMFLVYAALMAMSFFGLMASFLSFDVSSVKRKFSEKTPVKFVGGFLIVNSVLIALMWLSRVVPPLIDGSIYPDGLQHYTTLIVQGFDLGLLLPISFVAGWLFIKRNPLGYLFATPYIVFLSILMTALTAKIIAMGMNGYNIIPVVFIIPVINLITIFGAYLVIGNISQEGTVKVKIT